MPLLDVPEEWDIPAVDAEAAAAAQKNFELILAEIDQDRRNTGGFRIAAAKIDGLTDPEAAGDCTCSCHPRPADKTLHEGGKTCHCQKSEQENRQAMKNALNELLADSFTQLEEEERENQKLETAVKEAGFENGHAGGAAPFQVEGIYQGHRVYARERHGNYRVEVSQEPGGEDMWVIAEGPASELYGEKTGDYNPNARVDAVWRVAEYVNTHLTRMSCQHRGAKAWCPDCGKRTSPENRQP